MPVSLNFEYFGNTLQLRKSLYYEKTSFNQKNLMTPSQHSDTFLVQNELILHNFHYRTGFVGIW